MAKFNIKVKKKHLHEFKVLDFLDVIFTNKKTKLEYTLVTATNKYHFICCQLLIHSISRIYENPNISIYDLGMTPNQREWLEEIPYVKTINYQSKYKDTFYWEAWEKPFYMELTDGDKIAWIDADAILLNDFQIYIQDDIVFTMDYTLHPQVTLNSQELYKLMPLSEITHDEKPYLNTGFFCFDKKKFAPFLNEWCQLVINCMQNKKLQNAISCWDQGACKYILQKNNLVDKIYDNIKLNYPDQMREILYPASYTGIAAFFSLIQKSKQMGNCIHHYMGSPKVWGKWGELLYFYPDFQQIP